MSAVEKHEAESDGAELETAVDQAIRCLRRQRARDNPRARASEQFSHPETSGARCRTGLCVAVDFAGQNEQAPDEVGRS